MIPQTQRWHCFGCSEGGDVFRFLVKKEGMTFPEAVRYLAERAGITIHEEEGGLPASYRSRLMACCQEAAGFYHLQLMRGKSDDAAAARAYASSRGFDATVCRDWHIGYAPGHGALAAYLRSKGFDAKEMADANLVLEGGGRPRDRFYERLMFPIYDLQGRVIAFGGRKIPALEPAGRDTAEYINTSNSPLFHKRNNLYGIDRAKSSMTSTGTAIVVEGYTDVIAMHRGGFTNTVATLGTALTPEHVRLLRRFIKRVIYLFDGDVAGQGAADKASALIDEYVTPEAGSQQVELSVVVLPGNADPAEFLDADGPQALQQLLDAAQPLMLFALRRRLAPFDLKRPEQRAAALDAALELIYPFRDSLIATDYLSIVASDLAVDYDTVAQALKRYHPPRAKSNTAASEEAPASFAQSMTASGDNAAVIVDYSDELAAWERELLALYLYNPQVRVYLGPSLGEIEWSIDLHAQVADALIGCDIDETPMHLVDKMEELVPGSEQVWLVDTSSYLDRDNAELMALADRLLKGREIEQLERQIARHKAELRFPDALGQNRYDELFAYVVGLQNRVNDLRNNA